MSKVTVSRLEDNAEEKLVKLTAGYVREGIIFQVRETSTDFIIEFTGGY